MTSGAPPRTRVVNVKHEDCDVYIGRAMPGRPGSLFANRYRIGPDGTRAEVLAKHREDALNNPELLAQLESLRGKRLGCWCKPQDCHGDLYVELLEGSAEPPAEAPVQGALF